MGLLLPGLLIFGMFTVYPIIRLFWMSLCDMSFSSMLIQPFAGIMNYQEVFNDSTFWTVFVNSNLLHHDRAFLFRKALYPSYIPDAPHRQ